MIPVSGQFIKTMEQRRDFKALADVTLADGRQLTLTEEDFVISGNQLTDGAGVSALPLGEAVCRTARLELMNSDGHLDGYDFYGAAIRLWLTFRLEQDEERIELGTFTVTEPETVGQTVSVTAADAMVRADCAYAPKLAGNASLGGLWRDVCSACGIPTRETDFPNREMEAAVPAAGAYTCRQMLGYIAMLAGGNARIGRDGYAQVLAYDRLCPPAYVLDAWSSLNADTDSVTVTGLRTAAGEQELLEGEEGYVLQVENPLMEGRQAQALEKMGAVLIGLQVRRFDGTHVSYPMAECMDTVGIRDRRGREYKTVLTDVTFTFGGATALSNSAEDAVRNASRYTSQAGQVRTEALKGLEQEKAEREQAVAAEQQARGELAQQLQQRLEKAGGLYSTAQRQPDGSTIYYLHDRPTLEGSGVVMKLTADVIGFSTDGGKSYPYGFTVTGEMVMNVLQTQGINADWIRAGSIDLGVLKLTGTVCGLIQGHGSIPDGSTTDGIVIYGNGTDGAGKPRPPYIIVTNEGVRLQITDTEHVYFSGGYAGFMGESISTTGNINADGSINAVAGDIYAGNRRAVHFDSGTGLITYGSDSTDAFLSGKNVYVGEDIASHVTRLRGGSIYASKGIQYDSDRRLKKDIEPLPEVYARVLDGMTPVRFRYESEPEGGAYHMGYIAQDAAAALAGAGLAPEDMAAVGVRTDGDGHMSLAYGELVALLHLKIRCLERRLDALQAERRDGI